MGASSPARLLDHLLIIGRHHLEYVLWEFVKHYEKAGHTRCAVTRAASVRLAPPGARRG